MASIQLDIIYCTFTAVDSIVSIQKSDKLRFRVRVKITCGYYGPDTERLVE